MGGYISGISPTLRELVTPTVDVYAAGVGFTAGSSTYIDLSADPGSENNVIVAFDGVYQNHDTYSISGVRVTFDAAIPTGTLKIEARYAQEHPNYTVVADASITAAKLASGAVSIPPVGQCRLNYTSATVITLAPHNGNKLTINGTEETVNSQTLANTGLSAATKYYIYAYMVSTTLTLEASTTAYITHSDGTKVKSGATSYALVGMVYMGAGTPGTFINGTAQRFTRSWYNIPKISSNGFFTTSRSTTSTTSVEINSEARAEFIIWDGEMADTVSVGTTYHGTTAQGAKQYIGFDITSGAGEVAPFANYATVAAVANYTVPHALTAKKTGLSEGYHYATILGFSGTGTCVWQNQSVRNCMISVTLEGV